MNLIDVEIENTLKKEAPLASRMRPLSLAEFCGQEEIVGEQSLLYRAIKADKLPCMILCGPPGTGKTTLAKIIAGATKSRFVQLNATTSGIKDIKQMVDDARAALAGKRRTVLFIDEIHRFNKTQQDALLPHTENGTVIFIGATTENPFFEVNRALISRSVVFQLKPLSKEVIKTIIKNALSDKERGLGEYNINIDEDAVEFLSDCANGDARGALNALELAVFSTPPNAEGVIGISAETARLCMQKRVLSYDKTGDNHYDTISAFIKSMRGSDPDAAVHYLARMIYAGEDPVFIARRIVICASEDVGNADPHALMVAVAAAQAVQMIGLPECQLNLAQAALYVACAPKSNAAKTAIYEAMEDVGKFNSRVPPHLRDASYPGAEEYGSGVGYKYAHDYPGNYVRQQYLPVELEGKVYYRPVDHGVEKKIAATLERIRGAE